MKKYLIILFCLIVLTGCKKNPLDFRTKYIGDYVFYIYNSYNIPLGQPNDTIDGSIGFGSEKSTILILFDNGGEHEFTVYEDGTIEDGCRGEFESTRRIKYSCWVGSPGMSWGYTIIGEKK